MTRNAAAELFFCEIGLAGELTPPQLISLERLRGKNIKILFAEEARQILKTNFLAAAWGGEGRSA